MCVCWAWSWGKPQKAEFRGSSLFHTQHCHVPFSSKVPWFVMVNDEWFPDAALDRHIKVLFLFIVAETIGKITFEITAQSATFQCASTLSLRSWRKNCLKKLPAMVILCSSCVSVFAACSNHDRNHANNVNKSKKCAINFYILILFLFISLLLYQILPIFWLLSCLRKQYTVAFEECLPPAATQAVDLIPISSVAAETINVCIRTTILVSNAPYFPSNIHNLRSFRSEKSASSISATKAGCNKTKPLIFETRVYWRYKDWNWSP